MYCDLLHVDADDELAQCGFIRLFEPDDWFEVLPVDFILGRASIVPDFATPSIPHMFMQQSALFPKGRADSSHGAHDGSPMFYVNHYALTWSRCKDALNR